MNTASISLLKSLARPNYFHSRVAICTNRRIAPTLLQTKPNRKYPTNEQHLIRQASTTSTKKNSFALNTPFEIDQSSIESLNNFGKTKLDFSFNDSVTAFQSKSNFELVRGLFVFQLCGLKFLLQNQKILLDVARKILGKKLFDVLMKNTFYGHFVAGENTTEIQKNVESMMRFGVKSILDYSAEEDLESASKTMPNNNNVEDVKMHDSRTFFDPTEKQSEKNLVIFKDCIDIVSNVTEQTGLAAIKITSLIRPALLLKYSTLVDQVENQKVSTDLFNLSNMLGMSDLEFANSFNSIPELTDLEGKLVFTPNELGELRNMFSRVIELGKHAQEKQCRMFVDAEQTYFQAAIRRVTIEMMRAFNKDQCTVMNTYQNYLKNAHRTLVQDMNQAKSEGYRFGAKLVRGAYMEQERDRALKMGYEDPVNESYEATTQMYESSFNHCLEEIKKNPGFVNIMVASHNEDTVRFAVKKMEEYGVSHKDRAVCFGQLYGMCDFITFYLGGNGFSVFKYVPYGPVDEVVPYLCRRATENGKGLFEKVKKEKRLIASELKRRFLF